MARSRPACRFRTRMRLALGFLVLGAGVLLANAAEGEGKLADPLPIRRVLLPADRLAVELKKTGEGVYRRMGRLEFERLVQDAAQGSRTAASPRLAESKYRAKLIDASAERGPGLSGTAQWKVVHPGKGSALLRLGDGPPGMNFAISNPRFDNRDAILTRFPAPERGKNSTSLALLVDRPGEHTLTMDWSIRAETRPEGLFVDLHVPASPAATLELELPEDRTLGLAGRAGDEADAIVSGPHPADAANWRLWRVACGGRSQLSLLVRRTASAPGESVVLSWQETVQRLSPDGVESATTFSVESLQQGVRDLLFLLDAPLRPTEVIAADLEQWQIEPGPKGANRLRVRLSQPLRKGIVEVRCLASLGTTPAPRTPGKAMLLPWSSPAIVLEGAIPRGESLEIWMHPELRLLTWEPGDFRLIDSTLTVEGEGRPKRRRLTLQGGGIAPAGGVPRRPSGTLQAGSVEYLVTQQLWWRPRADTMELTARIECQIRQGQMFQIPLRLPKGWDVEAVDLDPADKLRGWDVRGGPDEQTLLVDLRRPLLPRAEGSAESAAGTLTVRLRSRESGVLLERDLPFPDVVPLGARLRSGGLAIDYDERLYRGNPRTALPVGEPPPAPTLWGETMPDHYYPFQGDTLRGTFRYSPRPPRSRASVHVEALVLPDRVSAEARLRLEAESGEVSAIRLFVSGPSGLESWEWTVSGSRPGGPQIRRTSRRVEGDLVAALAMIGGGSLNRLTLDAARQVGASWHIEFDRPLRIHDPLTLIGRSTRLRKSQGPGDSPPCAIPLVSVRDTVSMAGDLTLSAPGSEIVSKFSNGLRETGHQAYRWGAPSAWLNVRTRTFTGGRPAGATIDRACITSVLTLQGVLRHHVRFRISSWGKTFLPMPLPPGAKLLAAAVDARWLEPTAILDAEGVAQIPIPIGLPETRVELLYSTTADGFLIGHRLEAPLPDLPLTPISFQRRWLLPSGVVPLAEGGLISGPAALGDQAPSLPGRLLRLLRIGPDRQTLSSFGIRGGETSPSDLERQALADAFAGLRKERGGRRVRLERVVEDLVSGYLRDRCPVLVDRTALRRGGWSAESLLTILEPTDYDNAMPWKESGLVVVPSQAGVLLTTGTEARAGSLDQGEASDASGRFVTAIDWLAGPGVVPGLLEPGAEWEGWSIWAVRAGEAETGSLWVIRKSSPAGGGVLLACVLGLALLRLQGSARPLLLGWLGSFGLAALWLPASLVDLAWVPLVAGLVASFALYLLWASRQRQPGAPPSIVTKKPILESASIAGAVVAFLFTQMGHAQRPEAATVYLLEAMGKTKASVLVSAPLLERLEAMARRGDASESKPVLLSGEVTGRIVEGRSEFGAVFVAHSFGQEGGTIVLPLEGGQLVGDVLVDGARVLPEARTKPSTSYAIPLRGQGRHKIDLRFQVALATPTAKEADATRKQFSFGIPSLPQSRLVFQLPDGATAPEIPARLGPYRVVVEGKTRRLEADLGAMTTPVQVRWSMEGKSVQPARVSVREAHLWDLRADASLLTSFLQYTVRGSGIGSLSVAMPDGLEVRSVQARRPPRGGADSSARLSDWRVSGDRPRMLRMDFPSPVGGEIDVLLQLVPRQAWAKSVLLPIPRPLGVTPDKAMAYLAYRTQGIEARRVEWLRLNGIAVSEFAPFWPTSSRPAASAIEYASTFSGDAKQGPELRLDLRPLLPRVRATHTIGVTVGPALAEWHASVELTTKEKSLSLSQWDIQSAKPLTISAVEGAGVSRWVQSGGKLTVWFEKTTDAAKLQISGWVPLDIAPGNPPGQPRLEVPCLVPLGLVDTKTTLAIVGGGAVTVTPTLLQHLLPDAGDAGLKFRATQPSYTGTFLVRPGPSVTADLLTTVRLDGHDIVFATDIRTKMPGNLRTLAVRMRGWEGEASLEVKGGTASRRREQNLRQSGRRERFWSLDLVPDAAGEVRLRLTGRAAVEDGVGGVSLPDITLTGVQTRRVVAVEPSLLVEAGPGMDLLSGSEGATRSWQLRDEATARVVPRDQPRPPAVRAILAEHRSRLADGRRWLHEYRCWVRHVGPTEAIVRWPGPIEVVSATVGPIDEAGRTLTSSPERDGQWRIPLPASGTIHAIVIRYRHAKGERPDRPDLRTPSLEGTSGRLLRTIDVPAGWTLTGDTDHTMTGETRQALAALTRAAGRVEVCRDTTGRSESLETYDQARHRLERRLALAEVSLNAGGDGSQPIGPDGQTLHAWLERLKQDVRALPPARSGATAPLAAEDNAGRPVSWVGEASDKPPAFRLEPTQARATRAAFATSAEWLGILMVVALISMSNFSRTVARHLWPEQLVVLGLACWHFAGPGLPAVALVVLGVIGRSAIVARGLRALFTRVPEGGGSSMRSRA